MPEQRKPSSRTLERRIAAARARSLLVQIANDYTAFVRSRRPPNNDNPEWVKLTKRLKQVRALKRDGKLRLNPGEEKYAAEVQHLSKEDK